MTNVNSEFVHLHMHTQYSLLDGAIRFSDLFDRIKKYNMDTVAITDHGTMFGVVEFYEAAKKAGVKPILGCELYVAPRSMTDRTAKDKKNLCHLVLLAKNLEGYRNLCKLATIAQFEGFYYKPRVDKKSLQKYSSGLIALSACLHGEIPRRITEGNFDDADKAAKFYLDTYGEGNFYLEVQHNKIDLQDKVNHELREMSKRLSIPLVATNDCHYLNREDSRAHEVLLCIQTGKTMNDPKRFQFGTNELFLKSPNEMKEVFANYPQAIENTLVIAEKCNIEFGDKEYHFPKFNEDSGLTIDEMFQNEVRAGYETRMKVVRQNNPDINEKIYNDRLEYEIKIIIDMGFPGYFLIVADFISFSKKNGIPVGPGRGSAAGSIVAYSMGITELDPIEHGLIFERFLNPARASMPDIDVDFCINGRSKVFDYVVKKYGSDFVSQIITFGKLKARAVIRDVGRALDIPLREVDVIAKLVPEGAENLKVALEEEPKLAALSDERPEINELITISQTLEGLPRHASTHAAGVVISDKPLVEYLPLFKGKKEEVVTQFDMNHVEHIGLVKFDFLGLRNLTVIKSALLHIKEQKKTPPDLDSIDLEDSETYKLLSRGDTTGVFQLESSGMKDLLCRLKPECFNDITALVALYRPGPLDSGMVDSYVERKHGREPVEYLLPQLEPILSETYGVILYQEQVMKIAGVLANYSMADADGLRKAMGKKIPAIMAEHRQLFMKGAKENNLPLDKAEEIFSLMEKFGGYGFNKSHSAAYALVCYHTAYLKTHFLVEFMAALLTSEMNNIDGIVKFMSECKSLNVSVLPPDINESGVEFKVINGEIRFGLVAVKNVGENAIDTIIATRNDKKTDNGGKFTSLFDFCERVNLGKVNKRVIESLIKCGAFDSTGAKRSQMLEAVEDATEYGHIIQKEKADAQMDLFGDTGVGDQSKLNMPTFPKIEEWSDKQLLTLEKEILGFYISGHPLNRFEDTISKFGNVDSVSIGEVANGQAVRIGGMVSRVRSLRTKKGDLMAFIAIEDLKGEVEVVVFPKTYENSVDLLFLDSPLIIEGEAQKEETQVKILAETIVHMDKAEEVWTSTMNFKIDINKTDRSKLQTLKSILKKYHGPSAVCLHLLDYGKFEVAINCPDSIKVKVDKAMVQEVNSLLGQGSVETRCIPARIAPKKKNNFRGGK